MIKIIGVGIVALLMFWLEQKLYEKFWNRSLGVKIEFGCSEMFQGEQGELLEIIENRKYLPLHMLKVKFQTDRNLVFSDHEGAKVTDFFYRNDIFQIGGGEKITRSLKFTAKKRGFYKILGIDLVASDLFFETEMMESRQEECYLYVYPRPFQSQEFKQSLQKLNGEILTKQHIQEDPFEYRGIREYQPYDDMKSVNWKATAKTGELKVNQKNYTSVQTIRVFLNIEDTGILKKEDAVEMSMRLAAGLSQFFLAQGIRVALYSNGVDIVSGEPLLIEASAGSGQMDRIYKALARIDASKPVVPFKEHFGEKLLTEGKGIRTMLIAPNGYDDLLELLQEYHKTDAEYVWFYPIWEREMPKLPEWVLPHVQWIPIREEAVS